MKKPLKNAFKKPNTLRRNLEISLKRSLMQLQFLVIYGLKGEGDREMGEKSKICVECKEKKEKKGEKEERERVELT